MTPKEFETRLDVLIEGGCQGEHRTTSAKRCLREDWALVEEFTGAAGMAWFAPHGAREAAERRRKVLEAHSVRYDQVTSTAKLEEEAKGPPSDWLPPYAFKRALQDLAHSSALLPNRDELARKKLGVAWDHFVSPATHGRGMLYFDDVPPAERSRRLRMLNADYEVAWSRNPGAPAVVPAKTDPAGLVEASGAPVPTGPDTKGWQPLPPPGPNTCPEVNPWLTSERLTSLIEDIVERGLDETQARRTLGMWAFTTLMAIAPWAQWVKRARGSDIFAMGHDAHCALDREVVREKRRRAMGVQDHHAPLPDGAKAWMSRIKEDLQMPGNSFFSVQRLADAALLPADYAEALQATKDAIEGGRVDHSRSPAYLVGCLLRRARN